MTQDERKEMVMGLRELTGEGIMCCKQALHRTDWDMIKAQEWLRDSGRLVHRTDVQRVWPLHREQQWVTIKKPGSTYMYSGVVANEGEKFVDVTTKHPYHDNQIVTLTYRKEDVEYK